MSSNYPTAVDAFLQRFRHVRNTLLDKVWKGFMAYSMCIVTEAFRHRNYAVTPMNVGKNGFRFKCYPAGDSNLYSYFDVSKEQKEFEVRLSVDSKNLQYNSLKLNLDVVIINKDSIINRLVDAQRNLISFVECKNYRGFPELVATLEGMIYELQRTRFYQGQNFSIPACLFLSQSGSSILYMNSRYQRNNQSVRIFDMLQPGHPNIQNFIQNWF